MNEFGIFLETLKNLVFLDYIEPFLGFKWHAFYWVDYLRCHKLEGHGKRLPIGILFPEGSRYQHLGVFI